jgi:hypothetical protein
MTAADSALEVCERHLTDTNSFNTEVETYLVKYVLVLICSEFEELTRGVIHSRAASITDGEVVTFIRSATAQLLRSLRISDLQGLLARFAPTVKDSFAANVLNTPAHAAFDTIVNNRMQAAHTTGTVNLTLKELKQRYGESKNVIRHFAGALNVAHPC